MRPNDLVERPDTRPTAPTVSSNALLGIRGTMLSKVAAQRTYFLRATKRRIILPDDSLTFCSSSSMFAPERALLTKDGSKAAYNRPCSSRLSEPSVTRQLRYSVPPTSKRSSSLLTEGAMFSRSRCMMTVSHRTFTKPPLETPPEFRECGAYELYFGIAFASLFQQTL